MPGIAAHFACALEIERTLSFRDDEFYFGSILPDIISRARPSRSRRSGVFLCEPHFKVPGTYCDVPSLERFQGCCSRITGMLRLGYICHLLLDYHFFEDYCPTYISSFRRFGRRIFTKDQIYRDYSCLNAPLVEHFQIGLSRANRVLYEGHPGILLDHEKLINHQRWIQYSRTDLMPRYLQFEPFAQFITSTAEHIIANAYFWNCFTEFHS